MANRQDRIRRRGLPPRLDGVSRITRADCAYARLPRLDRQPGVARRRRYLQAAQAARQARGQRAEGRGPRGARRARHLERGRERARRSARATWRVPAGSLHTIPRDRSTTRNCPIARTPDGEPRVPHALRARITCGLPCAHTARAARPSSPRASRALSRGRFEREPRERGRAHSRWCGRTAGFDSREDVGKRPGSRRRRASSARRRLSIGRQCGQNPYRFGEDYAKSAR
jgi:hypothetical protein